jgi:hypothetical protein
MTFTEAAIEVLRREGKPLHFRKIAEIAIRESLLDHVGKIPDDTMADQLTAHCRLPHGDRRVMPVQAGTFALVEWGLDEDPAGLENLIEPPPETDPLYRGRERHPIPSQDVARGAGRGEARGRRREEEGRPRRFPPPAEVAYEILAGAGRALTMAEIAAQGAERLLMPDAFVRDAASLQAALAEDNRRRESSGRHPLFQIEGESVTLIAPPEPGERPAATGAPRGPLTPAEMRRGALAGLRRRLRECDGPTIEHVAARLLEKLGVRDLKVAKRGREHVIYTGRRRMGLVDIRHGIRIVRSGGDADRRDVADLRRDLGNYGAQIGFVITAGEAAREARSEAGASGQLPIVLLCGEALAEAFADAGVGCVPVTVPEVDDGFFKAAAEAAAKEEAARRARRDERDRRDGRHREERQAVAAEPPSAEPLAAEPVGVPVRIVDAELPATAVGEMPLREAASEHLQVIDSDDDDTEGDEQAEGDDELPEGGAAGAGGADSAAGEPAAERRRRRRRRRRRGGRGRAREGGEASGAQPAEPPAGAAPAQGGGQAPPDVAEPPAPSPSDGQAGGSPEA